MRKIEDLDELQDLLVVGPAEHVAAVREKISRASNEDAVEMFIECLRATPPAEREMMMDYLREKLCILCGADDPNCPCWEREEAAPS